MTTSSVNGVVGYKYLMTKYNLKAKLQRHMYNERYKATVLN